MRREYRYEQLTCDICGAEVTKFAEASETSGVLVLLTEVIPYAGRKNYHEICDKCNEKLIKFLAELKAD